VPDPSSPYADLDRPPLRYAEIARALEYPWTAIELHDEVASTNTVAADAARAGAQSGLVVVAETQTAGRGRRERHWESPPRAGLTMSLMVRPEVEQASWSLLSLVAGVGAAEALRARTALDVGLKWPNDLLIDGRKVGGLLAEMVGTAVVVGMGVNVTTRAEELPSKGATSLAVAGAESRDRLPLLLAILRAVGHEYVEWSSAGGAARAFLPAYRRLCTTIGQPVRAELPDGTSVVGRAVDVDESGLLVVDVDGDIRTLAAADVVHLLPA
jgi:BirA family biotin operon repressor/biotin-[acetyl-CoA-carboxylase] ligase